MIEKDPLGPYDYEFPKEAIAQSPAKPRDHAKLLVYNRSLDTVIHDTFKNLPAHLLKNAVIVFNQTKVIPARLALKKSTGGHVRILYLTTENGLLKVLADRSLEKGSVISLTAKIQFTVTDHKEKYYFLKPSFPAKNIFKVLERYGTAPIPPYIKETPLTPKALKEQYQTVFAKTRGSVAAPTASLHFTTRLISALKKKGVRTEFVTLHVGLGTFAPLTDEQLQSNTLHYEEYEIPSQTIKILNDAKKKKRPIIAVGTTVARTLESASTKQRIARSSGKTNLFIREGYKFKMVDGLITNFHVPKSSLLMLVAAFAGREKTMNLYYQAIAKNYRLFSFGDGMLIL